MMLKAINRRMDTLVRRQSTFRGRSELSAPSRVENQDVSGLEMVRLGSLLFRRRREGRSCKDLRDILDIKPAAETELKEGADRCRTVF
jgi:hypothetical protein